MCEGFCKAAEITNLPYVMRCKPEWAAETKPVVLITDAGPEQVEPEMLAKELEHKLTLVIILISGPQLTRGLLLVQAWRQAHHPVIVAFIDDKIPQGSANPCAPLVYHFRKSLFGGMDGREAMELCKFVGVLPWAFHNRCAAAMHPAIQKVCEAACILHSGIGRDDPEPDDHSFDDFFDDDLVDEEEVMACIGGFARITAPRLT